MIIGPRSTIRRGIPVQQTLQFPRKRGARFPNSQPVISFGSRSVGTVFSKPAAEVYRNPSAIVGGNMQFRVGQTIHQLYPGAFSR